MAETNWNEQADYLMQTRGLYLNDDYLEFLVQRVWRPDGPTRLVDFGCGFGYMGLKLLPLLPGGSSYTGVDMAATLLAQAREAFARTPYETEFIEADVMQVELPEGGFDVAICHALLLHLTDPAALLARMKRFVRPGGLVICIEPHWIGCMANMDYSGERQSSLVDLGILQKLFELDAERTGRDGNVGIKVPVYMDQVGLTEVDCRLSDKVNLLLPHQAKARKERLMQTLNWEGYGPTGPKDREAFVQKLGARGISAEDAVREFECETAVAARYAKYGINQSIVYAPSMMISFGRVPA